MCENYRWAIIRAHIWNGKGKGTVGYHLSPGRKYKTEAAAKRAWQRMETDWDEKATNGAISSSWKGKFEEYGHKIIEIPEGMSLRQAVDALDPGIIYYSGLAA